MRSAQVNIPIFPEDFREESLTGLLDRLPEGTWLQLPQVCEQATLEMLHRLCHERKARLGGVILGSIGQLGLKWELPVGAGSGIPVMNRRAASFLFRQGCRFVTASPELTREETAELLSGCGAIYVPAYGRTQLMLLHHCPARTALGLSTGHGECALCDRRDGRSLWGQCLTDRMGCDYPLLRQRLPEGCLVRLMNHQPTLIRTGAPRLLELTDETPQTAIALARGEAIEGKTGTGHWHRAVE